VADEAVMIRAAAVIMGLRYRNGTPLYGKTLQVVLGERPCRVIVVSEGGAKQTGTRPPEVVEATGGA
jgi:APA family basic amino acid/polyamine antiporter